MHMYGTKKIIGPDETSRDPATLANIMEKQLKVPFIQGIGLNIEESELVIKALKVLAESEQNNV